MNNEKYNDERKRKWKRRIIFLIVVLIIIHLILILSSVETKVTEDYQVKELIQDGSRTVPTKQVCEDRLYNYAYEWEGLIDNEAGTLQPNYKLINTENQYGLFRVFFSFYDEARYHFKDFEGKPYEEIEPQLPLTAASMVTKTFDVGVLPGGYVLVTSSVIKKDLNHTYWVYAHVDAPPITVCQEVAIEDTGSNLKYKTVTKQREVVKKMSLWDYLIFKWRQYRLQQTTNDPTGK